MLLMKLKHAMASLRIKAWVALAVADTAFFGLVDPAKGSLLTVVAGCCLLAITAYMVCSVVAGLVSLSLTLPASARQRLAVLMTLVIVICLMMQSVGQLTIKDVLAILPLAVVSYCYLAVLPHRKPDQP